MLFGLVSRHYDRENALIDLYIFLISQNSSLPKVENTFIFVELSNWRDCSLRDGVESYYETKDTDELNFLGLPLIIAPNPAASSLPDKNFEKERNSSALFAREINLVTQPSFDCEQGINSQVQTVCSNADAVFSVLGIVFCKNERFSLLRKTHVPLWNAPRISHVRLP